LSKLINLFCILVELIIKVLFKTTKVCIIETFKLFFDCVVKIKQFVKENTNKYKPY